MHSLSLASAFTLLQKSIIIEFPKIAAFRGRTCAVAGDVWDLVFNRSCLYKGFPVFGHWIWKSCCRYKEVGTGKSKFSCDLRETKLVTRSQNLFSGFAFSREWALLDCPWKITYFHSWRDEFFDKCLQGSLIQNRSRDCSNEQRVSASRQFILFLCRTICLFKTILLLSDAIFFNFFLDYWAEKNAEIGFIKTCQIFKKRDKAGIPLDDHNSNSKSLWKKTSGKTIISAPSDMALRAIWRAFSRFSCFLQWSMSIWTQATFIF